MTERTRTCTLFCMLFLGSISLIGCSGTPGPGGGGGQPKVLAVASPSTLASGVIGSLYSVQLKATGGTLPYNWVLVNGSTLPAGLTLSGAGLISGTPTAQGDTTFNVTVTDSGMPTATEPATFSITIDNQLTGNFAFVFNGFDSHGTVVEAGSFTADGKGSITAGFEDSNSVQGPPASHSFTGTYTIGSNNRGTLVFATLTGSPTYSFVLDATAVHGRMIELDSTGTRGTGEIAHQTVATCGSSTIAGTSGDDFAFGATGSASAFPGVSTAGPVVLAGRFTAQPPPGADQVGSLSNGESDANIPGIPTTSNPMGLSGNFNTTSQSARCTLTLSPGSIGNLTFAVYPIAASSGLLEQAFLVETDAVSSTTPYVTAGKMMHQTGYPFANPEASLTATSSAGLNGQFLSGANYVPDVAILALTGTGGTSFTMSGKENQAGAVGIFGSPIASNFVNADSFGRLNTNIGVPFQPVFYVIGPNEELCIGEITNNPFFGIFEPQSKAGNAATFTASTAAGALIEATLPSGISASENISGLITLANTSNTAGTVNGVQDLSTQSTNTAGQAVTGTYALTGTGATDGSGTLALTQPAVLTGAFFIVSPTKVVMITTTAADVNPVLITLGEQTDTFGIN